MVHFYIIIVHAIPELVSYNYNHCNRYLNNYNSFQFCNFLKTFKCYVFDNFRFEISNLTPESHFKFANNLQVIKSVEEGGVTVARIHHYKVSSRCSRLETDRAKVQRRLGQSFQRCACRRSEGLSRRIWVNSTSNQTATTAPDRTHHPRVEVGNRQARMEAHLEPAHAHTR